MITIGKKIDNDTFISNGFVVNHFLDGSFFLFDNEYDYKCYSYDNYPDKNVKPIIITSLYKLLKYLEDNKKEYKEELK